METRGISPLGGPPGLRAEAFAADLITTPECFLLYRSIGVSGLLDRTRDEAVTCLE
jgi:hypothetical protein